MASNSSSMQDRSASMSSETDYAVDAAASGGFFSADFKKHDDLKQMLDSSKDSLKLEAMKRIIGMIAKGRDASDLFPAVVKNVVSKNIEVKKLVYVYLVRYAEEQQDLALLSISTFQRALKDPNQLIRASALRVLSSIRVTIIVPIMMLAIRDSVNDLSPYVRKTAALAIPKLYSLEPELKDELVSIIEKLLSDRTTLVVGSAVTSFEQVCPERIDLIHKNYRKLCSVLIDVEEWGQVIIINMLTRYARTQFTDPNTGSGTFDEREKPFYEEHDGEPKTSQSGAAEMDPDLRLLLRNTKPLLQSRNSSVVMAVAQLYYHVAPKSELIMVVKALVRLLRSRREIQALILTSVASMTVERPDIFEPFLKNFFVRMSDPSHVTILRLEILTNLANEANITFLLREFQTYIGSNDKDLVAATIQAIGRCAARIKEVTDVCLGGLVALLSNADELIVAESVVVIKKLLQTQPECHSEIIGQMARLVHRISVPQARAAILWLLGENCNEDGVASLAPDVLRVMAKSFATEQDAVKLQILNLATKLCLTNPKQTKLLCQYVFSLAKYDQSYDIRDRARFLRQFLFPTNENSKLAKHAKRIFLAAKPAPVVESTFKGRKEFQLGSLSHYLNARTAGYRDLPTFPAVAPDPSVRNVEPLKPPAPVAGYSPAAGVTAPVKGRKKKSFYSDTEEEEEQNGAAESSSSSSGSSGSEDSESDSEESESEESESESGSESDSEESEEQQPKKKAIPPPRRNVIVKSESSSSGSGSETDTESESESDSSVASAPKKPAGKSNLDLLLDLDAPSLDAPMLPSAMDLTGSKSAPAVEKLTTPSYVSTVPAQLVSSVSSGCGLQILFRYTRSPYSYSSAMVAIELTLVNTGSEALKEVKVASKLMPPGLSMHEFPAINSLEPGERRPVTIGVDFGDSSQPVNFDVSANGKLVKVALKPLMGELINPLQMDEDRFLQHQVRLKGMNEHSCSLGPVDSAKTAVTVVNQAANLAQVKTNDPDILRFSGQSLSSKSVILVSVRLGSEAKLTVNCEKLIVGSILLNELKESLSKNHN